ANHVMPGEFLDHDDLGADAFRDYQVRTGWRVGQADAATVQVVAERRHRPEACPLAGGAHERLGNWGQFLHYAMEGRGVGPELRGFPDQTAQEPAFAGFLQETLANLPTLGQVLQWQQAGLVE